jgi:hypothetical protein
MRRQLSTRKYKLPTHTLYPDIHRYPAAVLYLPRFLEPDTTNLEPNDGTQSAKAGAALRTLERTTDMAQATGFLKRWFRSCCFCARRRYSSNTYTTAVLYLMHAVLWRPFSTSSTLPPIPDIEHRTTFPVLFQHVWGIGGQGAAICLSQTKRKGQ